MMMNESGTSELRDSLQAIGIRLAEAPQWPQLRAAHLDLVTITGRLQGALSERRRLDGETEALREAETALDAMKAGVRQVGMDIRLASERALLLGLEACLENAYRVLDALGHTE